MIFSRSQIRLVAIASLLTVTSPGQACEHALGSRGSPCACLSVAQDPDLNFSIRPAVRAAGPSLSRDKSVAKSIAIGASLKADALIFFRSATKGKEVSVAPHP
jgi:hypothetical protein